MKASEKLFILAMTLSLFSLPAMARDNHYSGYNSGLSLSLGNHHNGLKLHYSGSHRNYLPNKHYTSSHYKSKHFARYAPSASYKHRQFINRLAGRPNHALGSRNSHYNRYGLSHKKHYPYKSYYSRPYSNYDYGRNHYSGQKHSYRHHQKACHPITKVVSDKYGRYHSINNTLCYDKYGQSYIGPGRRH